MSRFLKCNYTVAGEFLKLFAWFFIFKINGFIKNYYTSAVDPQNFKTNQKKHTFKDPKKATPSRLSKVHF